MNWIRNSIANRISATGGLVLFLVLGLITGVLTLVTTERAHEQQVQWLHDRANGVANAIDAIDLTSRTLVQRVYPVLPALVGADLALDAATGQLTASGVALNDNFDAVDRFTAQTGGVATIFAKEGAGFKRIATSLKKEDGNRALGTLLDVKGNAYAAVSQGKPYTGRATLFGKPYMTHYAAVRDAANNIIGVLFIGFEIASFDAAVEKLVASSKLFDTGGIYVIDPKGKPDDAIFAIHPTAKGKKVLESFPAAKVFVAELASASGVEPATVKGKAITTPGLLSQVGNDRWSVSSASATTGLWVVAEVSDSEAMRTHWRTLVPFWALLAAACAALALGLLWLTRRQIGLPLRQLSAVAKAVADGNLSNKYTSSRQDEVGQVIRDVEAMRIRFLSLLTTLRQSAYSIATASGEIAAGNQDLSERTEQSAASLEETASSVERLTGTVKQTADSARSARHLATSTLDSVHKGAQVMQGVVATMGEINGNAQKIVDIIGVIDGIAFQTNILALNAAVEAARAGEQGRGFAVVASEVRSLAQRSATAAKEIKALIGGSVVRVETGTRQVASAGEAMGVIESEVRKVSEIIGEISHAADEQSDGISQVSNTINQLDRSTQQNAALVEQSAAAASSLQAQARNLSDALQEFQLKEAGVQQSQALATVAKRTLR